MKFGNKILISALILGMAAYSTYTTMQKGNTMNNTNNETYTVIAPNGREVKFDKNTNLIVSKLNSDIDVKNRKSSQNSFFKLVKSSTPLLTKIINQATLIQILTITDKRSIYPLNLGIN